MVFESGRFNSGILDKFKLVPNSLLIPAPGALLPRSVCVSPICEKIPLHIMNIYVKLVKYLKS